MFRTFDGEVILVECAACAEREKAKNNRMRCEISDSHFTLNKKHTRRLILTTTTTTTKQTHSSPQKAQMNGKKTELNKRAMQARESIRGKRKTEWIRCNADRQAGSQIWLVHSAGLKKGLALLPVLARQTWQTV